MKKINDRHEYVKKARAEMVRDAGYDDILIEPRREAERDQTRADISFKEPQRGGTKEIVHITDDTGGHPLSPSHFERGRERTDPTHTLTSLDQAKAVKYREYLERARAARAVTSGMRVVVFRSCSFTSLGALGKDMIKFINGAAGYCKRLGTLSDTPRDDGLLPPRVAGLLRFRTRAAIQAAILTGNAQIARAVGL
jgi:hypothetical protein